MSEFSTYNQRSELRTAIQGPGSKSDSERDLAAAHQHSDVCNCGDDNDESDSAEDLSRAMWSKDAMQSAAFGRNSATPDLARMPWHQMLGLDSPIHSTNTNNQNLRRDMPTAQLAALHNPREQRSLIDWNALSAGQTIVINPLAGRNTDTAARPDPRRIDTRPTGGPELPRIAIPELQRGPMDGRLATSGGKQILEQVRDPAILARVPDALYIGQRGLVTSMNNRQGEVQDYWLSGPAARAFAKAQEMLASKGKQMIVSDKNGAGRTVDTQSEIYSRSRGGRGFAAGKPTMSNHTRGNAMDVSNWNDPDVKVALRAVGFRQGDSKGPIKNDLHHWSFAGTPQEDNSRRRRRA